MLFSHTSVLPRKIVVVMPAYNAAKTLKITYDDLPHGDIGEVILVDDASRDETVRVAKELGLTVYVHSRNYRLRRQSEDVLYRSVEGRARRSS